MTKSYKEIYLEKTVDIDRKLDTNPELMTVIEVVENGLDAAVNKGEFTFPFAELETKEGKSGFADVLWDISRKTECTPQQVAGYIGRHFNELGVGVHETKEFLLFFVKDVL